MIARKISIHSTTIIHLENNMSDNNFNMSMRKFLKQVGVTSQQKLEDAATSLPDGAKSMKVKMVLTAEGTDLNHVVEGTIELDG